MCTRISLLCMQSRSCRMKQLPMPLLWGAPWLAGGDNVATNLSWQSSQTCSPRWAVALVHARVAGLVSTAPSGKVQPGYIIQQSEHPCGSPTQKYSTFVRIYPTLVHAHIPHIERLLLMGLWAMIMTSYTSRRLGGLQHLLAALAWGWPHGSRNRGRDWV